MQGEACQDRLVAIGGGQPLESIEGIMEGQQGSIGDIGVDYNRGGGPGRIGWHEPGGARKKVESTGLKADCQSQR